MFSCGGLVGDGKLIDDQKFVIAWFVPVDQPDQFAVGIAVFVDFKRYAFGKQTVKS